MLTYAGGPNIVAPRLYSYDNWGSANRGRCLLRAASERDAAAHDSRCYVPARSEAHHWPMRVHREFPKELVN